MEQRFSAALKAVFRCGFSRCGTSGAEAQCETARVRRLEGLLHPRAVPPRSCDCRDFFQTTRFPRRGSRLTAGTARSNSGFDTNCISMKRWQFSILIFELALFAIILFLPQVALPDFTFHDGTAPVAAHSRVCDRASGTAIAVVPGILPFESTAQLGGEIPDAPAPPAVHTRLSRLCVLIC
jgi:hypothetical protein